jgi:hypothetical protein
VGVVPVRPGGLRPHASDDRLALLDARALGPVRAAVDAEAARRGFEAREDDRPGGRRTHLDFLGPVPRLLADQERRAKQPARRRALELGPTGFGSKAEYVAALVADLEEVNARQMGQPGGVSLAGDPVVDALIKQGDAAVEPLLGCLETDERLTRSVHFHRDFFFHRSLLGVHEAAYVALAGVLKESFFGFASTGDDLTARGAEGRRAVAARARAHWEKFRHVPLHERWYLTLQDDKAGPQRWAQAAANVVQPTDVEIQPGSMFGGGWVSEPSRRPGQRVPLHGDPLRGKRAPAVAELWRPAGTSRPGRRSR